jgi:hypothetical protein
VGLRPTLLDLCHVYSGDGLVSSALAQLTEDFARAPLNHKSNFPSRVVELQMDPIAMKAACFGKLQQALTPEAKQDRTDGRAIARSAYKALETAVEAKAAALAGTLRSGTLRSGTSHSGAAQASSSPSTSTSPVIVRSSPAVDVPADPFYLKGMWVRTLFNAAEKSEIFAIGMIGDVSAATNEVTIKFPVDGTQIDAKMSEINNEYITLITKEAAIAELARSGVDTRRTREKRPPSLLRQPCAARQGASCLSGPKKAGQKAIPRELLALLDLDGEVMLAHIRTWDVGNWLILASLPLKLFFANVVWQRNSSGSSSEASDDSREDPTLLQEELEQEEEENEIFEEHLAAEAWKAMTDGEAPTKTKIVSTRDALSASGGVFEQFGSDYVEHLNRENAKRVYAHVAKSAAKGASVQEALRTAGSLPLDMMLDKDDVGTNEFNARRQRLLMQVETRPRFLFDLAVEERGLTQAMVDQGLKHTRGRRVRTRRAGRERVYSVPQGLTLFEFSTLYQKLLALAGNKDFSVSAIPGAPVDGFTTMAIRIPPFTSVCSATAGTDCVQGLVQAVVAPFYHSRAVLRSTAFHLRLAGLMMPSRGTEQSYWGYTGNGGCEKALCAVAYGVDEGRILGNHPTQHPSLRVPTLVHTKFVRDDSETTLADRLEQLVVARHKHCEGKVSSGPWSGPCAHIFGDGIESLGEANSTALVLLLAKASPDHAKSFLDTVRKPVRLGGEQSLAIHSTMALYSTGPFLAEAKLYLEQVLKGGYKGDPPGVLMQQAASKCIKQHCAWALPKLKKECRSLLEKERSTAREPLDTMHDLVFVHGTPAAARDTLNDLAARGRINKQEVCTLSLLLLNWACMLLGLLSLTTPPSLTSGRPPAGCRRRRVWIDHLHTAAHQGVRGQVYRSLLGAGHVRLEPMGHSERCGD